MPLRIHFSDDDFANSRVAQAPDPMWEVLLSLHMLQTRDAPRTFGLWRARTREQLPPSARALLDLAPPRGYSPDFLTPAGAAGGLDLGIGALLSTARTRLRADLAELAAERRLPGWTRALADGDPATLRGLAAAVRAYHRVALAPYWPRVTERFAAGLAARTRAARQGTWAELMTDLPPGMVWRAPVLTLTGLPADRDLHLRGRGLLLLPSFFCWHRPTVLRDPGLPPVVVHPLLRPGPRAGSDAAPPGPLLPAGPAPSRAGPAPAAGAGRGLAALLGRTRAVALEAVALGRRTTTELADAVGVSAATASHHAAVLRGAGLLSTRRDGGAVRHTLTPLGLDLLDGGRHLG
ncbi:winged helix-turn-helix domain-containing protein [Streptomyces capparidis]